MENKSNFNRELSAEIILKDFVSAYTHGRSITEQYSKFINTLDRDGKNEHIDRNLQRRKIIEKCRDLFKDISKRRAVDKVIDLYREQKSQSSSIPPTDYEITKLLLRSLPDLFWGDDKRQYNMSHLASKNMIATRTTPEGTLEKDVTFIEKSKNSNSQVSPLCISNKKTGESITIEYLGRLQYSTASVPNEYLFKLRISKTSSSGITHTYDIFSNIDINTLQNNRELCYAVVTELLSTNNIEYSQANGYIGEISDTSITDNKLEVGQEHEENGYYKYQVTPRYALVYDGERIEAVRAYNQQQSKKKAIEQIRKFEEPQAPNTDEDEQEI